MNETGFVNLELDILDWDRGQLTVPGRKVPGRPCLDRRLLRQLQESESDVTTYGHRLFKAILPEGDPMRASYRSALEQARRAEKLVRFKLNLSLSAAGHLHQLRWECLYDVEGKAAIARDPETAFSRYAPIGRDDAIPALDEQPRLLVAVAAPYDCEEHHMTNIDREVMEQQLDRALAPLSGQVEWEFLTGPVTLSRLRSRLKSDTFHAVHLVAHSYVDSDRQVGVLVLEQPTGECDFVKEEHLSEVFLGDRDLRLLTLVSCHGGTQSLDDPLSGLGRRLVERGLPAVICMQETVSFETAEEFPEHFYESLALTGCVDAAVNEARHQLFLRDRYSSRWSDPILFMRLQDGAVWRPAQEVAAPHDFEDPVLPSADRCLPRADRRSGSNTQITKNDGASIKKQFNAGKMYFK